MSRRHFLVAGVGAVSGLRSKLSIGAPAGRPAAEATLGQSAPGFNTQDATGRARSLTEFKGKPVVLEWSSPSCPFAAAQYKSGRMQELQRWAMGQGVVWLTVLSSHPSRSDHMPGAQAEAFNRQRGGLATALLIDASGGMGRAYGAATANHMFVIAADGTLAYAGGIDDSQSMDPKVVVASRNFVRAALEDLIAERRVATPSTEPYGCALAYAG